MWGPEKYRMDSGRVANKVVNIACKTKLRTLNKRNEVPEKESQKGLWLLCDPKESIKNKVKQQLWPLL